MEENYTEAPTQPLAEESVPKITNDIKEPFVNSFIPTSSFKFGYGALGFFLGLFGILIAWLVNKDTEQMNPAIKYSAIGLGVCFGLNLLFFIGFFGCMALIAVLPH